MSVLLMNQTRSMWLTSISL